MTTVNAHIQHYLRSGKLIALPGIGVFEPVRKSAVLDGNTLEAPSTSVVFTRSFDGSDSTLAASITRKSGIEESAATHIVADETTQADSVLASRGTYVLEGVGTLTAGNNALSFAADGNILAKGWLRPVELRPIETKASAPENIEAAAAALADRRNGLMRQLSRTASSAAAIAVLALITFIFSQLPSRHTQVRQTASIGIERIVTPQEPVISTPGASESALVLVLNTPADGVAPAKTRAEKKAEANRYFMVVASLASEAEARSFIEQNSGKGFDLGVLCKDGRRRVYALSGATIDDVTEAARTGNLYSVFPSAWICTR